MNLPTALFLRITHRALGKGASGGDSNGAVFCLAK